MTPPLRPPVRRFAPRSSTSAPLCPPPSPGLVGHFVFVCGLFATWCPSFADGFTQYRRFFLVPYWFSSVAAAPHSPRRALGSAYRALLFDCRPRGFSHWPYAGFPASAIFGGSPGRLLHSRCICRTHPLCALLVCASCPVLYSQFLLHQQITVDSPIPRRQAHTGARFCHILFSSPPDPPAPGAIAVQSPRCAIVP